VLSKLQNSFEVAKYSDLFKAYFSKRESYLLSR
jgi:hypothetical protein